jgi:hypothetical protein
MRTRIVSALAAVLLCTAVARADHYSDFYVLPAAAHTPGVNGTMWMSDVAIQNFQSTPLTVELAIIESGEGNSDNVFPVATGPASTSATVPANGSVLLRDILKDHRGLQSVTGAILIGSDRPFAVTSRTYSMTPEGNTIGQTVPPVRDFIENTVGDTNLATAVAYVPGLIDNASFRSNLGAVVGNASSTSPLVIGVTVRDAAGTVAGTRTITVGPGNFTHLQFNTRSLIGTRMFDIGSAEFRITEGNGAVVPYASVIDNGTADAVFSIGVFPDNAPLSGNIVNAASKPAQSIFRQLLNRVVNQ